MLALNNVRLSKDKLTRAGYEPAISELYHPLDIKSAVSYSQRFSRAQLHRAAKHKNLLSMKFLSW